MCLAGFQFRDRLCQVRLRRQGAAFVALEKPTV